MKAVKLRIPIEKAEALAIYSLEKQFQIALSWPVDDFLSTKLICVCAIEEARLEDFKKTDWAKYIIA